EHLLPGECRRAIRKRGVNRVGCHRHRTREEIETHDALLRAGQTIRQSTGESAQAWIGCEDADKRGRLRKTICNPRYFFGRKKQPSIAREKFVAAEKTHRAKKVGTFL